MADITVTAASVRPVGHCIINRYTASTTITPGMPVYISANNTVTPCNGTTVAAAACIGLAISNSDGASSFSAGEEIDVLEFGMCEGFATTLAANTAIWLKDAAGTLQNSSGTSKCRVGIGVNTTKALINPMLISTS